MSAVEATFMMAFMLPTLLAMSGVREELRMVEPKTRFGFGIGALSGSVATFLIMMKLLPGPASIDADLSSMTLLIGGASITGGGFVLSIVLIGSAFWQALTRWKFHRSNVS